MIKFFELYNDDCGNVLQSLDDDSVNLIVTSPPYANQRKASYGGMPEDEYVEWFCGISAELYRILKSDGSFILNIKENVKDGERSTYVLELILALKQQGWLWTEEYIWHKTTSVPGKWPNRFRDAWERCLHFTKSKKFNMNQDEVMVPIGDWSKTRLKNLSENDRVRTESDTNSGFGKNLSNWVEKDMVYPSNVLHMAPETQNKQHSATYPQKLSDWFVKLFSNENDLVLDPFMGSGTTGFSSIDLHRRFIGIEILKEYYEITEKNFKNKYRHLDLLEF